MKGSLSPSTSQGAIAVHCFHTESTYEFARQLRHALLLYFSLSFLQKVCHSISQDIFKLLFVRGGKERWRGERGEPNINPLQEQQMPLTTELCLQPLGYFKNILLERCDMIFLNQFSINRCPGCSQTSTHGCFVYTLKGMCRKWHCWARVVTGELEGHHGSWLKQSKVKVFPRVPSRRIK